MRRRLAVTLVGVGLLATVRAGTGMAQQMSLPSIPDASSSTRSDKRSPYDSESTARMSEQRAKMLVEERKRMLGKNASTLLQVAAELQLHVKNNGGASHAEMLRQADEIEKLAHDVKERMKGSR